VALTQTQKKTREHKSDYIQLVREFIEQHKAIYVYSYENMRTNKFKNVRMDFKTDDSRLFLGKNKLLQLALGRTPEDEFRVNLRQVSKFITGYVGLLITSRDDNAVRSYFDKLSEEEFARFGNIASKTAVVTSEQVSFHPVGQVELFRKLGLPVDVNNGKLVLIGGQKEYVICKKGDELTAEQCKLLTHFDIKLAEFKLDLLCRWTEDGSFEEF